MKFFKKLKAFANFSNKIKNEWKNKTPKEKLYLLYGFMKRLDNILQLRVLSTNKVGWIGYSPVFFLFIHISLAIYTFFYYVSRGRFSEFLPCCCFFGSMVSSYLGYLTALNKYRFMWPKLCDMPGEYIYHDDHRPSVYNSICSKSIDESLRAYVIKMTMILLSFGGAVIGPYLSFIRDGSLVTLYEIRIPYCDQHPYMEYVINLVWQFAISMFGGMGILVVEGGITLVNDSINVSSKITSYEFNQLSDLLEARSNNQELDAKTRRQLIKIYMNIHYMDNYIQEFGKLTYWLNFLSPRAFTYSISLSVFCQYMLGYPAGYGFAVLYFVQMALLCYTGENIVKRNQRILDDLYDIKWYLLPTRDQKDVMHMMNHMQNGFRLTIGPFEKLNYETLKILGQKVYSFLMFLMKMH